ncbi:MAG: DNA methyltransferase [Proteobacteria bacterium]|nr:MAG: DNA methyltransferase [Pseudomonadota bacterium]
MENQATAFILAVVRAVKRIPKGKVATYGQIAKLAGNDHGARGVGWILHAKARAETLPWQRVINRLGQISFHEGTREYAKQRRLLENEGVRFDRTGTVDLEIFGWKAKRHV